MKAILYARFSPRPHESDAIRQQMADMESWCENNGHDVVMCCYDPQTSGTIPFVARPGLAKAMGSLKRDMLLVFRNLNRAARSVAVGLAIEEEVDRIGARMAVLESGGVVKPRSEDLEGWTLRVISWLMADVSRQQGNERTSRAMLRHMRAGRRMGGDPPYGWDYVAGRSEINEDEQKVIQDIKDMAIAGYTYHETAKRLRRLGLKAKKGGSWQAAQVRRILTRERRDGWDG